MQTGSKSHVLRVAVSGGLLFALAIPGRAEERITSFESVITVHSNASVEISEIISVTVDGSKIKRGILRKFPTRYRDRLGNKVRVDFDVLGVTRNGTPEHYAIEHWDGGESAEGGVTIRIGKAKVDLPHAPQKYAIQYRTNRQLGYFKNYDEIYWNVTGNEWEFAIDRATAAVLLPAGVPRDQIKFDAYAGRPKETGTNYQAAVGTDGTVRFESTRPLAPGEGLTIVVGWPKGHVHQPTAAQIFFFTLRDNRPALAAFLGLVAALVYYLIVWIRHGKDPEIGVIVPRYEPPENLSPAAARYIWKMGYDSKCFAASLINLGVNGNLRMRERDGKYTVMRLEGDTGHLQSEEKKLFNKLLGSRKKLTFKQDNHSKISSAVDAFKKSLLSTYEKKYFLTNRKYWWPGILFALGTLWAAILLGHNLVLGLFMGLWLSIWTVGVIFLGHLVYTSWVGVVSGSSKILKSFGAIFITFFALPFFAGEAFGLFILSQAISPAASMLLVCQAGAILVFYHLLKAPTRLGRQQMDQLEGFRRYLTIAEQDRLAFRHPPRKTPEHFEKFLPYALALDVEQEWAEYFSDVIDTVPGSEAQSYGPTWYSGSSGRSFSSRSFTSKLGGSLAAAISSTSTAPGSSSGFRGGGGGFSGGGGGGFSGGGGGGGGGGGW